MSASSEKQRILQRNIFKAVEVLRSGGVVAAATETFFGLLADVARPEPVRKIKSVKGVGPTSPMLVIVKSMEDVFKLCESVPPVAVVLAEKYWPGPLTMIFRAKKHLPGVITGHTGTLALRIPGPCDVREILTLFKRPLTATSCNPHGHSPAITGRQAMEMFKGKIDFIVPGSSPGGLPSTIVDVTVSPPVISRRGITSVEGKFLHK